MLQYHLLFVTTSSANRVVCHQTSHSPHQPRNAHSNPLPPRPLNHEHASINPGTYLIIVSRHAIYTGGPSNCHSGLPDEQVRRFIHEERRRESKGTSNGTRTGITKGRKGMRARGSSSSRPWTSTGWMVVRKTDCLERLTRFNSCHKSGTIMSSRHAS